MSKYYQWIIDIQKSKPALYKKIQNTQHVKTNRGMHIYVECKESTDSFKNSQYKADVRGNHTYVLTAPSVHPSGKVYSVRGDRIVHINSITDLLNNDNRVIARADNTIWDGYYDIPQGNRVVADAIRNNIDIIDFVGKYTSLKYKRNGWWVGKCPHPSHNDRNPSFAVNEHTGRAVCYSTSCVLNGATNDIIGLYSAIHGIDYKQAIQEMADKFLIHRS
jgi:hypothetical protein